MHSTYFAATIYLQYSFIEKMTNSNLKIGLQMDVS